MDLVDKTYVRGSEDIYFYVLNASCTLNLRSLSWGKLIRIMPTLSHLLETKSLKSHSKKFKLLIGIKKSVLLGYFKVIK